MCVLLVIKKESMSERIRKINALVAREVADELSKTDLSALVTVKAVETTPDMKSATVWIGVLGGDEETVKAELEEKRRDIQQAVNAAVTAKYVPVLNFKIDHSGEYAEKIEELLKDENSGKS
ncbi:ribosome-binding factor A [candidate division WS5 bacterium]|uniref:Ribosome-binding factor A n=1 Tax=candidate division WS5 bacterium TaxID=2093353 RepID=A0A419DCG9_9BACT|nr:MAG: ribosome-binding factor A [candidate division WS5 bacterium]